MRVILRTFATAAILGLLGGLLATPALATPPWLTPLNLSVAGQDAEAPQVAVDPAGNAVAVWSRSDGADFIVQSASRPAGGAWTAPVDVSVAGRDALEPQVALDSAGNAVAVWQRHDGSHTIVQSAARPAGGSWVGPVDLSEAGRNAEAPQLAVDPAGNAVAVWVRFNGTRLIVQSASKPAGGAWDAPVDLSVAGQNAETPQVAVDPAGNAVAVWSRYEGANLIVQSASRPAGWAWAAPVDLSVAGQNAEAAQVAVDPAGDAVAVWSRFSGGPTTIVQGATSLAGGAWGSPVDLSAGGVSAAETPQVAVDPAGNALAVWSVSAASPSVVQSASKPQGAAWQPAVNLSEIGRNSIEPQVALDPAGDGVATWTRENGPNPIVQAVGYDGAGPQLRGLSIPAAGTVRQPVSFSVSPFDVWSAIGSISWSFGDEGTGGGAAVTHAFARPGVYQVGVTAADVLGHATRATGTVRIYPKATAGRNVRVRGGKALLRLHCPSPAGCEGVAKLIAGTKAERRRRAGRRMQIGRSPFSIPGDATTTVPINLTAKGKELVRRASRNGVKSQLTGPGVKHRIVALLAPRRR